MPYPGKIDRQQAIAMYRDGKSLKEVAAHFGCTVAPLRRAIMAFVQMRAQQGRLFDRQTAAALYQTGLSTPAIAQRLGVSHPAVQRGLRKMGVQLRSIGQARNAMAKATRVNAYGYRMVRVGPRSYRLEHRLIAERCIGRPLKRSEYVHHVNCNRTDNRPENLLVCTLEYHNALHGRMRNHPYWSQFTQGEQ